MASQTTKLAMFTTSAPYPGRHSEQMMHSVVNFNYMCWHFMMFHFSEKFGSFAKQQHDGFFWPLVHHTWVYCGPKYKLYVLLLFIDFLLSFHCGSGGHRRTLDRRRCLLPRLRVHQVRLEQGPRTQSWLAQNGGCILRQDTLGVHTLLDCVRLRDKTRRWIFFFWIIAQYSASSRLGQSKL